MNGNGVGAGTRAVGKIAAVVLAAGRSSRMGRSKPLLPVGAQSVLGRVVGSAVGAGVDEVVVVTGHRSDDLADLLGTLPVREAHNAGYDAGMFSSVKTGVRAVGEDAAAFFVLPADYPLIGAGVFARVAAAFDPSGPGILHPTCCGRRGHPTLISSRFRTALLREADGSDLRSFLRRQAADEAEVEVADLTILMDMDTEEEYERLCRFAASIDRAAAGEEPGAGVPAGDEPAMAHDRESGAAARAGHGAPATLGEEPAGDEPPAEEPVAAGGAVGLGTPSYEDALYLLSLCAPPEQVERHCHAVAAVGEAVARAIKPQTAYLDVDLVRVAGLLHDMARTCPKHAAAARDMLNGLGLSRLAAVVGAHRVLPPEQADAESVSEEQLVYLADKLVIDDRVGTLADRAARMMREWGPGPVPSGVLEGMKRRMRAAEIIQQRVEALLGRPLDEVLPRKTRTSI